MIQVPESERLSFRLLTDSDLDAELLWQLDQDPAVMKFITRGRTTTRQEIADRFLPRLRAYRNPKFGWGLWGVFQKSDDRFIGWILIRPMGFFAGETDVDRDDRNLEIGWRFQQASWGQGFATEAARAVAGAIIAAGECDQLSAIALPENSASIQVMKKLGLEYSRTSNHDDDEFGVYQLAYYSANVAAVDC